MNRDIDALTPATAAACRQFLLAAAAAGLNVFVTETLRTAESQAWLYASGRTRPGRILTGNRAGTSKHETGCAFDVAFRGAALYPDDEHIWLKLGLIGEQCGLFWGGRWESLDKVHFQTIKEGRYYMGKNNAVDAETMAAAVESVKPVEPVAAKSFTVKDLAKYGGLFTVAVPVLSIVFPQWAVIFKALGSFLAAVGAA